MNLKDIELAEQKELESIGEKIFQLQQEIDSLKTKKDVILFERENRIMKNDVKKGLEMLKSGEIKYFILPNSIEHNYEYYLGSDELENEECIVVKSEKITVTKTPFFKTFDKYGEESAHEIDEFGAFVGENDLQIALIKQIEDQKLQVDDIEYEIDYDTEYTWSSCENKTGNITIICEVKYLTIEKQSK